MVVPGQKFLRGDDLSKRMNQLWDTSFNGIKEADRLDKSLLDVVKTVGDALIEAKWRKGKRGKWGKWLRALVRSLRDDLIQFSVRTAQAYMQIAKSWDLPAVVEARDQGSLVSINGMLQLIQKVKRDERVANYLQKNLPSESEAKRQYLISEIRSEFNKKLKLLRYHHLEIFDEDFDKIWGGIARCLTASAVREADASLLYDYEPREPRLSIVELRRSERERAAFNRSIGSELVAEWKQMAG